MSTLRVDGIRHNSATSDAITTASDGTCTAKLTSVGGGQLSHRNLIINGAMNVAQRGTSSTTNGYSTVDRFFTEYSGQDEVCTFAQVDVASTATPYTSGFRKALKITNGNQTSGAGSSDKVFIYQRIEAQDLAQSGWNYTSASSFITLQFWVKSSVAQNFYGYLRAPDGTSQNYPFETGSLSADTWTKVTKTIPGNSNLTIDNNNSYGLEVLIAPFYGTDNTGSVSLNAWAAFASATRMPDYTPTWWTTNDATFEITGVQLEVGDTATSFEHRSFGEELIHCQRYYETCHSYGTPFGTNTPEGKFLQNGSTNGAGNQQSTIYFRTTKRANPTVTGHYNGTVGSWYGARSGAAAVTSVTFDLIGMNSFRAYNGIGANYAASEQIGQWQAEAEL